jgi:hypothetical protein
VTQPEIQRQHEIAAFTGEVLSELPSDEIEAARSPQDAWADLVRECLQYPIMILTVVRDPDQALIGCRQEQCAEGRIHRPVRNIKHPVSLGGYCKLIMKASHRLNIIGVDRGEYGITGIDHNQDSFCSGTIAELR